MYFGLDINEDHNKSNDNEIYLLRFIGSHKNPVRQLISKDNEIFNIIRDFHIKKHKTLESYG